MAAHPEKTRIEAFARYPPILARVALAPRFSLLALALTMVTKTIVKSAAKKPAAKKAATAKKPAAKKPATAKKPAAKKAATAKKPAAAKKAAAKKPAAAKKAAASLGGKKMLYAPESGSDVDIAARVKAAIAILNDKPGSALKTQAAVVVLEGVLKVML